MTEEEQGRLINQAKRMELRVNQLEADAKRARKRSNGTISIVAFVMMALLVYHFVYVRPLAKKHAALVDTFNENVDKYNDRLLR